MHLTGMPYVPGRTRGHLHPGMCEYPSGRILVIRQAEFLTTRVPPAGFLVIDGAPFAHAMIPILGSGVPTVIVDSEQARDLPFDREVMLDGSTGLVTSEACNSVDAPPEDPPSGSMTSDGTHIELRVSVRDLASVQRAVAANAEAVGLVRSEFLLPANGQSPDTKFYHSRFSSICETADPLPVTIRLLDIGGDKVPPWLPPLQGLGGPLGRQGVRLYEEEPVRSVYQAQLAAIDELSGNFDIRVLIPFLSNRDELLKWSRQVRHVLSRPLQLGAMAETPTAVLQIAEWFELVDFVALGCNDLMQCLFGADRDRPELRHYLDPYTPSLYRFLRQVASAAQDHLNQVQMCGALPQLPGILPVLLGLGFRVFSVDAASLPYLRRIIASTSITAAESLAEQVCAARDSHPVRQLLVGQQA